MKDESSCFEGLDKEVSRMEKILSGAEEKSIMDTAVVAVLKDKKVRAALSPILAAGAHVKDIVVGPAGDIDGVVQLDIATAWNEGAHAITLPPIVTTIIQIEPPRVLELLTREGVRSEVTAPFTMPEGRVPTALKELQRGFTVEDITEFGKDRRSIIEWLEKERLAAILESVLNPATAGGAMYMTSGSKCTSWFCFEKTAEDSDLP